MAVDEREDLGQVRRFLRDPPARGAEDGRGAPTRERGSVTSSGPAPDAAGASSTLATSERCPRAITISSTVGRRRPAVSTDAGPAARVAHSGRGTGTDDPLRAASRRRPARQRDARGHRRHEGARPFRRAPGGLPGPEARPDARRQDRRRGPRRGPPAARLPRALSWPRSEARPEASRAPAQLIAGGPRPATSTSCACAATGHPAARATPTRSSTSRASSTPASGSWPSPSRRGTSRPVKARDRPWRRHASERGRTASRRRPDPGRRRRGTTRGAAGTCRCPVAVAVAPADADRVAAHQGDRLGPDVRADRARVEQALARQLVHAAGARAPLAEHLVRKDAPVTVGPRDVDLPVLDSADLDRRRVWHCFRSPARARILPAVTPRRAGRSSRGCSTTSPTRPTWR